MPAIPIAAGSSPRMRGKLTLRRRHDHCERIIPAHAGQTDLDKFYGDVNADHPRACGANDRTPLETLTIFGSSPRMRGKPGSDSARRGRIRIIPAHAGQTTIFLFNSARWSDHPRACGANPCRPPIRWMNTGSSPRMRGKRRGPARQAPT